MKVIGTAGHIDHGKSALVHRLTGIDPDRLVEEKRRGMTIDLGFAWLRLPRSGDISVVDVPGHERFIKNMLAGAGGIDVALLVVAADESVMPQTREHLDILHLLGVNHGVIALTKADLVDEEFLELARSEVIDLVQGTALQGSAIVPVSALTGAGIGDLMEALDEAVLAAPMPECSGFAYVPVDRVFTIPGFGTVVTGTLHGGTLAVGDEVDVVPVGTTVRIRTLQSHGRAVETAGPGTRVAINLAGVERQEVARGDVVASPGFVRPLHQVDVFVNVLRDSPVSLNGNMHVAAYVGAAERMARISPLESSDLEPGSSGWAHIRFEECVPAARGQRFVLRLPAPAGTIAGGEIVDIAPRLRRSPDRLSRLVALRSGSLAEALLGVLPADRPREISSLARILSRQVSEIEHLVGTEMGRGTVLRLGNAVMSPSAWRVIKDRLVVEVRRYHRLYPYRPGMPKEELRRKVMLSAQTWHAIQERLSSEDILIERGTRMALPDHIDALQRHRELADQVVEALKAEPYAPPDAAELRARLGIDEEVLGALVERGEIVRAGEGIYLERGAYEDMVRRVVSALHSQQRLTVAEVRDLFGTTRKYALALLEYLDGEGITRRQGDIRVLGPKAAVCV